MTTSSVTRGETLLLRLRGLVKDGATSNEISGLIGALKLELTTFHLTPPFSARGADVIELSIARETYELAALAAVAQRDGAAFNRAIAALSVYYHDFATVLPPSPLQPRITGLALLKLLSDDNTAAFAAAVELIDDATVKNSAEVQFVLDVAAAVTEGRYVSVLTARQRLPASEYAFFLERLMVTVRNKIGDYSESAYSRYPLSRAHDLLLLDADAVTAFCASRHWTISGADIVFPSKPAASADYSAVTSITQNLTYANELERIV